MISPEIAALPNVLQKIVEDKFVTVEQLKREKPLASFIDQLVPTEKDMYAALAAPNAGFILECKKASPSKGLIRPDFDVKAIAQTYEKYAAAISVLTDEKYFQGTFDYLQTVTSTVSVPVLNKDFFVDPYQVHLARYYGADAILLMLSVLNDEQYRALAEVAEKYKLAILTEISTPDEMERAIALDAKLIGINNRNLRDLSTDINRTFDYTPHIPDDRLVISESGIYTHQQVRKLAPAVDGFLVGSSIMAEDDIDLACRRLIFGNNKICGLTDPSQADAAYHAGAVYGGLIFAEKSPRVVSLDQAQQIVSSQPALNYVGVFVDHSPEDVADLAKQLQLSAVQLHGEQDNDYITALKPLLPAHCQIWRAYKVEGEIPELNATSDLYLLDGKSPGSGQAFRWQALADTKQDLSACFLAGGLSPDNITEALAQRDSEQLFGLDINSGVESSPGQKCQSKINQVFDQIRNY